MRLIPYSGGPLNGQVRRVVLHVPARVVVTAREGGGFSNVDSYYELVNGEVLVWQGPER